MSNFFKDGDELDQSEAAMFMVLFGLLAYMVENQEAIVVKSETIQALMLNAFETDKFPYPVFQEMEGGFVKFGSSIDYDEEKED